jgi:hypothetical protein
MSLKTSNFQIGEQPERAGTEPVKPPPSDFLDSLLVERTGRFVKIIYMFNKRSMCVCEREIDKQHFNNDLL